MEIFILTAVLTFGLIVAALGIALAVAQRQANSVLAAEGAGKHPQGYWMGVGIASGLLIGYVLSLILGILIDDMATFIIFGPSTGLLLGVALGVALEQQHKDELRPLTAAEQRVQRRAMLVGAVLALLVLLVLVGVLLLA